MIKNIISLVSALIILSACGRSPDIEDRMTYAMEIEESLQQNLLNPWYPKAIDYEFGGFLSAFEHNFEPGTRQVKMIVSQARHVWTTSKAYKRYPATVTYKMAAEQGFNFLRDHMWDTEYGGFHTLVTREGEVIEQGEAAKSAYGNAFAIYGLAAYYDATNDEEALELAKETFLWLEEYSYDKEYWGYFQHLARDGSPILRKPETPSTSDLGYKDQNSSIHLLEAFTELYRVWPDELLRERLNEMLVLIRDTIADEKGVLTLFFEPNWTPVTFQDESREVIEEHYYLDHVSFGHDIETAFLMIEASHVLGLEHDERTHQIAKKMVDHSLRNGFDEQKGGFYDGGYYFSGEETISIVRDTKNWWAQAEGMNSLLLMAKLYPEDEMDYFGKFEKQWEYIDTYLIDHVHGGWFEGGLDKQPEMESRPKGHIWKTTYHNYRAMAHSVDMLKGNSELVK